MAAVAGLSVLALAGYVAMVLRAPEMLLPSEVTSPMPESQPTLTSAERLTAIHNARLLAISFGGALVVLAGLLYTARNYRLAHRGQVADRLTKALERLGSDELYVRIGGIHVLEHVLLDSAEHHEDIVQVLVAFIRQRAPRVSGDADSPIYPRRPPLNEPEPDVQAALTALARRPRRLEHQTINLMGLHLQGGNLFEAWLRNANLTGAQLQGAVLWGARLDWANLTGAQLQGAVLWGARLESANLTEAQLQGANLRHARLVGAKLVRAQLRRSDLTEARVQHANLAEARLEGAKLKWTQFRGANLSGAVLKGVNLFGARLRRANLSGAGLEGANMDRARLQRANLSGARLEDANLSGAWLGYANLSGAELKGANLSGARLQNTILTGVDLTAVDLTGAQLQKE